VVTTIVTFYAGLDNTPPGSNEIAHPNGRHPTAGGTGTYADPTTLATDPRELPVGRLVYCAPLQRYFVMEDDCDACIAEGPARPRRPPGLPARLTRCRTRDHRPAGSGLLRTGAGRPGAGRCAGKSIRPRRAMR